MCMRRQLDLGGSGGRMIGALPSAPSPVTASETTKAESFLTWLKDSNKPQKPPNQEACQVMGDELFANFFQFLFPLMLKDCALSSVMTTL